MGARRVRWQKGHAATKFACYLNSNLARETNRLLGREGHFWEDRYHAIVVSGEEAAQVDRLIYTLSNGCKEGLVGRLAEWPGVHAAIALLEGRPVQGTWFDRTQAYGARQRRDAVELGHFAETEVLELVPLPCWDHVPADERRRRIAGLIRQIEEEAAAPAQRKMSGVEPAGPEAILRQSPFERPKKSKKSPAPRFHAFTRKALRELYEAYRWFVAAFREASEKLRAGDRNATFPTGSFPPRLPFVRDASLVPSPAG